MTINANIEGPGRPRDKLRVKVGRSRRAAFRSLLHLAHGEGGHA
jgi:hypothetical protein